MVDIKLLDKPPPAPYSSNRTLTNVESEDVIMGDATITAALEVPKSTLYTVHQSANDIPYAPEDALKQGLGMVRSIHTSLNRLQLGSKLRQDVWMREIER